MKLNSILFEEENILSNDRVLDIPFGKYQEFLDALEKINKKALKYKVPPLEIKSKTKEHKNVEGISIPCYRITFFGEPLRIKGWQFCAVLEHTPNGKNILRAVPGKYDPKFSEYLNASNRECDYCHTNRDRNYTYLIKNIETGELKRVGGSCLQHYVGDEGVKLAKLSFNLDDYIFDKFSDDEDVNNGSEIQKRGINARDVDTVLGIALYWIDLYGYQGANDTGKIPTSNLIWKTLTFDNITPEEHSEAFSNVQKQHVKIENIKKWINGMSTEEIKNSPYFQSVKSILDADFVSYKSMGLMASLPYSYTKNLERQEISKNKKPSEYIGSIGEKIGPINVKIVGTYTGQGMYGSYQIVRMQDVNGNLLMWFNTGKENLEDGKNYEVRGTVKKHEDYKDTKTTVLTRVKAVQK